MPAAEKASTVSENLLNLKSSLINRVAQGAGLGIDEMTADFNIKFLPRIPAWDTKTSEWMNQLGLASGGLVNIPLVLVAPRTGRIAREGVESLRYRLNQFDGDMELVPNIGIGFETEDNEFVELEQFHLFADGEIVKKGGCFGLRWESGHMKKKRHSTQLFELTEGERWLFNDKGLLKSDKELETMAPFLTRMVNLNPETLVGEQVRLYQEYLSSLGVSDKADFISSILDKFGLSDTKPQAAISDGDIPVELCFAQHEGYQWLSMRIKDILVPKPKKLFHPENIALIVRPKEGQNRGDLMIDVVENGYIRTAIERDGYEDANLRPVGFDQNETLAILLAKLV